MDPSPAPAADFFKALAASGVSRRRSAVPAAQRGSQAWFAQAVSDASPLLPAGPDTLVGAAPAAGQVWLGQEQQAAAAQRCWAKADRYYFASMARLQRLWEVRLFALCCEIACALQPPVDAINTVLGAEPAGIIFCLLYLLPLCVDRLPCLS